MRWVLTGIKWALLALPVGLCGLVAAVFIDGHRQLGAAAAGARLERMQRSPQWSDGHFENPEPLENHLLQMLEGMLHVSAHVSPEAPVPVAHADASSLAQPPASGLRVTWLGHATNLIEIEGMRVLTDPMWGERASPVSWAGPRRWYPTPWPLSQLPAIDAVVISHDHYDHLDMGTIEYLNANSRATFVVPLGVGAHLEAWGVAPARLVELDWWERTQVGSVEIVCVPARHASGRKLLDQDAKLWAGYALIAGRHRVYFSGDTGLFKAMRQIGQRLGPFDLTMIEVGQYHRAWPDWHIGPEQAITAHQWLRGRVMMPMHWGLFALAYHGWTEPIERVVAAAHAAHVPLLTPKPGEPIEPTASQEIHRWWPQLPWQTAKEHPIVSTRID